MGATIGINSFLLLAIAFDILSDTCRSFEPYKKLFNRGYWLANISLLIFWFSLIGAGLVRARWQMSPAQPPFSSMMLELRPYLIVFFISGLLLTLGLALAVYPLIKNQLGCYFQKRKTAPVVIRLQYSASNKQ
jgi:nitric oxide reductase subunit B